MSPRPWGHITFSEERPSSAWAVTSRRRAFTSPRSATFSGTEVPSRSSLGASTWLGMGSPQKPKVLFSPTNASCSLSAAATSYGNTGAGDRTPWLGSEGWGLPVSLGSVTVSGCSPSWRPEGTIQMNPDPCLSQLPEATPDLGCGHSPGLQGQQRGVSLTSSMVTVPPDKAQPDSPILRTCEIRLTE